MMSSVTGGCPLALVILLLVSMDPTATEVVRSVSICKEFFLEGTPPEIPGVLEKGKIQGQNLYKPICQTYKNTRRFMTLYDTVNKIPVFSAYKYTGHIAADRQNIWKIEPQLENERSNVNMRKDELTQVHQASSEDYKNIAPYNRGHLFPNSHANNIDDQGSTFTLTNVVPQVITFNSGSWNRMEKCIKCVMDEYCFNQNNKNEAFVVTGAIPSLRSSLNNGVNIPKTLWTAFCCYSNVKGEWLASAHWGDNVDEKMKTFINTRTLADLKSEFSYEPFNNTNCLLASTGSQYYTGLRKGCECPPQLGRGGHSQPFSQPPRPSLGGQVVAVGKAAGRRMLSLLSCAVRTVGEVCRNIYNRITG